MPLSQESGTEHTLDGDPSTGTTGWRASPEVEPVVTDDQEPCAEVPGVEQ